MKLRVCFRRRDAERGKGHFHCTKVRVRQIGVDRANSPASEGGSCRGSGGIQKNEYCAEESISRF